MTLDIHGWMGRLAVQRRIFHSEADFQHALAWLIQRERPDARIRLETRPERNIRLDILVDDNGWRTAIELKYLAARFCGTVDGERYDLPNQGAHDISRHDVCKDIARVEKAISDEYSHDGWVVVLSNDGGYWRPGTKADPIDKLFRIHEGRIIEGDLAWGATAGAGTTRKRDVPLSLAGRYPCEWRRFSMVERTGRPTELRYLALHVSSGVE